MYCSSCGQEVNKESNFCKFCGTPISKVFKHQKIKNNQVNLKRSLLSKTTKRWFHIIFSTIGILSIFFGAILLLAMLDSNSSSYGASDMDYMISFSFLFIPFIYFFIYINSSKNEISSWNLYKKNTKILIILLLIFWLIGKVEDSFSEYFTIIAGLLNLIIAGILFWLTGKQIKHDTNSKWSYWCGSLVAFFWGLGAYYGAKEFREKKKVTLVGKILTIIAYILNIIFLWLIYKGVL